MKTKYKVRYAVADFKKGDVVYASDFAEGINVPALVDSQILTVDSVEGSPCPACVEQGVKKPPKFDTLEQIHEHYADKHAGLVPPSEDDLDLEKEAEPSG